MKREEGKGIGGSLNGVTAFQIKRNKMGGKKGTIEPRDETRRMNLRRVETRLSNFSFLPNPSPLMLRLIHACASTARGCVFNMYPRILPWINQAWAGPKRRITGQIDTVACSSNCAVKTRMENRHQCPHANNSFENLLHAGFINQQAAFFFQIERSKLRAGNWHSYKFGTLLPNNAAKNTQPFCANSRTRHLDISSTIRKVKRIKIFRSIEHPGSIIKNKLEKKRKIILNIVSRIFHIFVYRRQMARIGSVKSTSNARDPGSRNAKHVKLAGVYT